MGLVASDRVKLGHLLSEGVDAEAARADALLRPVLSGGVAVVLALSRYGRPLPALGVQAGCGGRVLLVGRHRQQDEHAERRPQRSDRHGDPGT